MNECAGLQIHDTLIMIQCDLADLEDIYQLTILTPILITEYRVHQVVGVN